MPNHTAGDLFHVRSSTLTSESFKLGEKSVFTAASSLISRSQEEQTRTAYINYESLKITPAFRCLYLLFPLERPPDDSSLNEWALSLIPPYVLQNRVSEVWSRVGSKMFGRLTFPNRKENERIKEVRFKRLC